MVQPPPNVWSFLKNAAKAMVRRHLHNNMVKEKARRDLAVTGIGRARISQLDTAPNKPHQHYTTSHHINCHHN
jgi:hypothetical protein